MQEKLSRVVEVSTIKRPLDVCDPLNIKSNRQLLSVNKTIGIEEEECRR